MDQPGLYECVVTVPGQQLKTINTVSVTRLAAIYRNLSGNKQEVMVTDYLSGKPVEGAIVTYYGVSVVACKNWVPSRQTGKLGHASGEQSSIGVPSQQTGKYQRYVDKYLSDGFRPSIGKEPGRSLNLYGSWALPSGTNHFLQRSRLCKRLERPACRGRTAFYGDLIRR